MVGLRIIFLDIDGVICCNMVGHLEENKLAELKRIVRETGAKARPAPLTRAALIAVLHGPPRRTEGMSGPFPRALAGHVAATPSPVRPRSQVVLSTDWRRQAPLKKQLRDALARLDIDCIGATPMRHMMQPVRPQEITSWLAKSTHEIGAHPRRDGAKPAAS